MGLTNYNPWAKSSLLPELFCFVNKSFIGAEPALSFMDLRGYVIPPSRVEDCGSDCDSQSKGIYSPGLLQKRQVFPAPKDTGVHIVMLRHLFLDLFSS